MSVDRLFDLSGEVAVVTGAGRGIGEGIARLFAEAGAGVVVAARRTNEIEKVAAEITEQGGRALAVTTDVTDDEALAALADAAVENYGRLSIWVNNAGGSRIVRRLTKLSRQEWDDAIALNLTAAWAATVAAAKRMETGCIINISSLASWGPVPGSGHYAASKAALNSLTETFARELAPKIRVNGVAPGIVPTEVMMDALRLSEEDLPKLLENSEIPLERLGTAEDVAAAVLYLAAPSGGWVTGRTIAVSGGM